MVSSQGTSRLGCFVFLPAFQHSLPLGFVLLLAALGSMDGALKGVFKNLESVSLAVETPVVILSSTMQCALEFLTYDRC